MNSKLSYLLYGPNKPHIPATTLPPLQCSRGNPTCEPPPILDNGTGINGTLENNEPKFSDVDEIGHVYLMPVVCAVGITLNALTVLVFSRKMFRSPIYTYLSALAVADCITAIFTFPIGVSRCGSCDYLPPSYSALFYDIYIYVPITNASETCSAYLVMTLAIERLLTVRRLERTSSSSRNKAYAAVACVVFSAAVLNAPFFFAMEISPANVPVPTLFGRSEGFLVYSWIRAVAVQFLPLVVLIVLNVFLIVSVRRSHLRYRRISVASKAGHREKAQMRLSLMMVGTVVLFIVSNIPIAFSYSAIFAAIFGEASLNTTFYNIWRVVSHLLAMVGYALDFVVYCAINRHFQIACSGVLTCKRKGRKISDVSPSPSSNKEFLTPTKF